MSEVQQIPIPLSNYLGLIERKQSPYYDLLLYILADLERTYKNAPQHGTIYTINPRQFKEEVERKISSNKLTPINISRTVLALMYGSKLRKDEDYYVTTSSGGRKNYHIKVTPTVLSSLQMHL
ncbi:MAG: hypothetical protein WCC63_04720 [Candidatus Bathyarchaeia archaeon]